MSGETVSRGNYLGLYLYRSLVNYGGAASREEKSKEGGDNAIPLPRIERKKKVGRCLLKLSLHHFSLPSPLSLVSISQGGWNHQCYEIATVSSRACFWRTLDDSQPLFPRDGGSLVEESEIGGGEDRWARCVGTSTMFPAFRLFRSWLVV